MNSITVERVCAAAENLLNGKNIDKLSDKTQRFVPLDDWCFVDEEYKNDFLNLGLNSIDSIFNFQSGENLTKKNLADYRSRTRFQLGTPPKTLFLKRYQRPPLNVQLDKALDNHAPISCGMFEANAAKILTAASVNTAKVIAYGQQMNLIFENKSFMITEQVPAAQSLEQKLPEYFNNSDKAKNLSKRRNFIIKLANFIKTFHNTGFCHRDLYLCHIFCDENEKFTLIDLARAFQPWLTKSRYRIKDIAQLYYSAPGKYFSRTDRLRFYKAYKKQKKLNTDDKTFIRKVVNKTRTMTAHDKKHGRNAPYTQMR
jgi:heptose I phosphotransferase